MKNSKNIVFMALISLVFNVSVTAATSRPTLKINNDRYDHQIQINGQTNVYYRFESSQDFLNWSPVRSYFYHTNNANAHQYWNEGTDGNMEYIRAAMYPTNWVTMNNSIPDNCPEHDNLNIVFRTNAAHIYITSTHPTDYVVNNNVCNENWTGCPNFAPILDVYQGPFLKQNVYDVGTIYVIITRLEEFWRPLGMTFKKDGITIQTNITFIEFGGNIPGTTKFPIYGVIYTDGYLRWIPFPPVNFESICFGNSVLIGPAEIENRPHADISIADFRTATKTLNITYRDGGTAILDPNTISRTSATAKITVGYSTAKSTCTLRSMYVADGNSDCDQVVWTDNSNVIRTNSVMPFYSTSGKSWLFKRHERSLQRESAPNTRITFD
ncbi:MAG: hypothetical protein WCP09_02430 [Candidatus Taylorbacteria bacterium]